MVLSDQDTKTKAAVGLLGLMTQASKQVVPRTKAPPTLVDESDVPREEENQLATKLQLTMGRTTSISVVTVVPVFQLHEECFGLA